MEKCRKLRKKNKKNNKTNILRLLADPPPPQDLWKRFFFSSFFLFSRGFFCFAFSHPQDLWKIGSRIISNAKRINSSTYDCMQEIAIFGAQVLDMRAAMLAAKYQVPLLIAHVHTKNLQALTFLTQIK